jgi:hypothetical protein
LTFAIFKLPESKLDQEIQRFDATGNPLKINHLRGFWETETLKNQNPIKKRHGADQ